MGAVVRREKEPRDASDFMMDTIAGHFALGNSLPQPLQVRRQRHWPIGTLLVCAVGLLITAAAAAYVGSLIIVLIVAMRHSSSAMVRPHRLVEQSPPAGQWVRRGATVVLTTSTGIQRARSLAATAAPYRRTPYRRTPYRRARSIQE